MKVRTPFVLLACLTGCGSIPRDPEGTLDHIRSNHVMRVGWVAGVGHDEVRHWHRLVTRLARATGSRPSIKHDALEPLLLMLEAGEVDMVVGGRFAEDTPWRTRVTLGPSFRTSTTANGKLSERAAARNGENAWIILTQREAKALEASE